MTEQDGVLAEICGWLRALLQGIVDRPEEVQVRVESDPAVEAPIIVWETSERDVPMVIGTNGHIVSSIRSLLSAKAGRHKIKVIPEYKTDRDIRDRKHRQARYASAYGQQRGKPFSRDYGDF
jgi:predicted RNA-binding protein YlqC (UPF0109 family)